MKQILILMLGVALTVLCGDVVQACPTCKDALLNDPAGLSLARGYQWSIIFMMSMPFSVFAGISGYFYYLIRKARGQNRTSLTPSHPSSTAV